jgi:hypothetical protein
MVHVRTPVCYNRLLIPVEGTGVSNAFDRLGAAVLLQVNPAKARSVVNEPPLQPFKPSRLRRAFRRIIRTMGIR